MAEEVRRVIDIQVGTEVTEPKLGFDLSIIANAVSSKAHLQALPTFNDEGAYFYVAIRSHQPQELRAAFEEFLNTSLSVAKEMSPEVDAMVGATAFDVGVHEDLVIAAVNLKDNDFVRDYAHLAEELTKSTVKGEARIKAGLLVDTSFQDLLTMPEDQLSGVKGNFHIIMESRKSDKYAIKQKFMETFPPAYNNEDKYGRLLFLMFNGAEFHLNSSEAVKLTDASGNQITKGRGTINGFLEMGKEMYQGNKEMVDSFPFIQSFFDAVEQYGSGLVRLGAYNKLLAAEADFYGNDLGQIYKRIVS